MDLLDRLFDIARARDRKIVLPEGDDARIVVAAARLKKEKIAQPILLGSPDVIGTIAKEAGVDLIVHLSAYHRADTELRRLASLAFVAENRENDLGATIVSHIASYRVLDDSWEWRREAVAHMPDKIWKKLLAAGINPDDVVREVIGNGES